MFEGLDNNTSWDGTASTRQWLHVFKLTSTTIPCPFVRQVTTWEGARLWANSFNIQSQRSRRALTFCSFCCCRFLAPVALLPLYFCFLYIQPKMESTLTLDLAESQKLNKDCSKRLCFSKAKNVVIRQPHNEMDEADSWCGRANVM